MKFIRILPDTWASTLCPFSSSTRNIALGSGSTTVPSTSIASSLAMGVLGGLVRPGQDLGTPLGDRNGVLEVGGPAPVHRHRGPAILQHPHLPRAHRHHRLDGEHHSRLHDGTAARVTEVRDLGLLVEALADPVPHEGPHHPEAVALAVRLHRVGDVTQAVTGPAL